MNSSNNKIKRIAVLGCYKTKIHSTSNALLIPAFEKQGLTYEELVWDAAGINWHGYDAVIVRTTWDYIEEGKRERFLRLLNSITQLGIPLFNPAPVLSWNSKKSYLHEIKAAGISVIDSIFTTRENSPLIAPLLNQLGGNEFVFKPAVSAGAYKTFRVTHQTAQEVYQANYGLDEEVILQPFVSEIVSEGEIAFVFFEGIFSHAIKQTPKPRDFRVQYIHGGTAKKIEPERWMIEEATRMLEIALKVQGIEDPLLYARVDCVKRDNKLVVMELELIEPELYFNHEEDAADNFAACLHGRLACGIDSDFGANPGQYPASHVVG